MSTLIWPVPDSQRITSPFGNRSAPVAGASTDHKGIDIGGDGLDIVAAKSGKVEAHNPNSASAGNMLWIRHEDGSMTKYLHMRSGSNTVTTGSKVLANQVIGKVGSTGNVTGPHLHFEYLPDGSNPVDPMPYFNDDGNSYYSYSSDSADIASEYNVEYEGNAIPYNPKEIIPIRSLNILKGKNMHAYFKIFIGPDLELRYDHNKPNIYQTFEINRLESAGSTAQFTIFDDNWDEIEYYLSEYWDKVYMQYGYSNGYKSPKYEMMLSDYSIDFNDTGTLLSIKAISNGVWQNINGEIDLFDTQTKNPGEAIKAICEEMNWKIDENFAITKELENRNENYILRNENPITYIQEVIIPEARSENDEILTFYLEATEDQIAYLKVVNYGTAHTEDPTTDIRTYIYQKGYDSVVESISFDIKGIFGGTANLEVNTKIEGSAFGLYSKEEYSAIEDQSSVATYSTGIYSHTMSDQAVYRYGATGESQDQLENKIYYYVKNSTTSHYEATMVMLGDPTIELFEDIRIINITDFGQLHHTSGIYIVKGIVDSIENGIYRTTLKLQRNGDINNGVELINPRYLVK